MDSVAPSDTEFENVSTTYYVLTKRDTGSSFSSSQLHIEGITTDEAFATEWRLRTGLERDREYDYIDLKSANNLEEVETLKREKELRRQAQAALTYIDGLTPDVRDALRELGYGFPAKDQAKTQ